MAALKGEESVEAKPESVECHPFPVIILPESRFNKGKIN